MSLSNVKNTKGTVLITGADRGLGLGFCKYYLNLGYCVIACCLEGDNAKKLPELPELHSGHLLIIKLDVSVDSEIQELKHFLKNKTIDILINNAGVTGKKEVDYCAESQPWQKLFSVNTIAPYLISHALKELVYRSEQKKIVNIGSAMASISMNKSGRACCYRASKAALNAITKNLAIEFSSEKIIVVVLEPGWVKTDMGGPLATLTVEESVLCMAKVIDKLTIKDSGKFISYSGGELSW